ncbi:MAG TPA: hypothetical protein VJ965_10445 [Anaerolineales bacterium]|nr:hypothetical protein [Anaerolineales bacterium]
MIFNRPWLIVLLAVMLVLFTAFQFVRFGEAVAWWSFLAGLPMRVPPLYLALTGLGWGVFGGVAVWQLWLGKPAAKCTIRILSVTYALYYWVEQLLLMTNPLRNTNWRFDAVVSVFLVLFILSILQQEPVGEFIGVQHEQEKQD